LLSKTTQMKYGYSNLHANLPKNVVITERILPRVVVKKVDNFRGSSYSGGRRSCGPDRNDSGSGVVRDSSVFAPVVVGVDSVMLNGSVVVSAVITGAVVSMAVRVVTAMVDEVLVASKLLTGAVVAATVVI